MLHKEKRPVVLAQGQNFAMKLIHKYSYSNKLWSSKMWKGVGGMVLEGIWVSALAIPIQLHSFLFTISPHFINVKKRKII